MFKVLLIVYVLGGGGSINVENRYNTNFVFQEFYSMTDCKAAEQGMKDVLTWNRTRDTKDAIPDPIEALYSTKCIPMTATAPIVSVEPPDISRPSLTDTEINHRVHRRWDDK